MDVYQREDGTWVADGVYDDRLIVAEGETRYKALFNWSQTATGGMTNEGTSNEQH